MSSTPEIARVGFGRGLRWLFIGGELLGRGSATLLPVAGLLLAVLLLQHLPMIGPMLLVVISPLITAGLLVAFHAVAEGRSASAGVLFAGWNDTTSRGPLLALGLWFLTGSILALLVFGLWVGPQLEEAGLEGIPDNPEALIEFLAGADLLGGIALAALVMALVLAALYFAVPLVHFARVPVGRALVISLRAVLANWLAFLGFGLALIGLMLAIGIVAGLVGMIFGLALGPGAQLVLILVNLVVTAFVQVLTAGAQYCAFRDVFGGPGGPNAPGEDGQLEV